MLELPPGPVVVSFASDAERRSGAWPMASAKSKRRTVVDGLPRFEYTVGALEVIDVPAVGSGPDSAGSFSRSVSLQHAPGPDEFVGVRLARAEVIEAAGPRRWRVDGERPFFIEVPRTDGFPPSSPDVWIVPVDGALELRAAPDNASVYWSLQW